MAHQFFFNPFILDNLPAPNMGFDVVQDISEPRLRMYITSRGVKSFFVRKRIHGKDKRIIIGNYPDVDIESARSAVPEILEEATKKQPVRHRKILMGKFLDLYLANRVRRSGYSYDKLERSINKHIKPLFEKYVSEISSDDVALLISEIQGRAISGRMQELLQSVFKYAIDMGYVKQNPVVNLPKVEQKRRVRPLNKFGLNKLHAIVVKEEPSVLRAAFLMLIYGFLPKSKIFSMQWKDLDFNHYMWCDWPLSDAAVTLLQDLPQDSRWVFPGKGRGHLTDPRLAWKHIAEKAGIPNLTMDDVHKFLTRKLVWASDKEELRENMNTVISEIIT